MREQRAHEKEKITFVLVADASRARLYRKEGEDAALALIEELEHPESRAMNRDLMADKPGRSISSGHRSTARSGMEYRTDPKEVEAEKFARTLVDKLAHGKDEHTFDDLVIAAPPKFLGLLRGALGTHTNHVLEAVTAWIEKDYTQLDVRTIAERIAA